MTTDKKLEQRAKLPTPPSTGVTPKKKAKKDLILTKAKAISDKTTWFHGTNTEIAALIRLEGFKEDTWFSRHMEDAVKFGGPHVFVVKMMIDNAPLDWQIHMANALPPSIIVEEKYVAAAIGVTERGFEEVLRKVVENRAAAKLPPLSSDDIIMMRWGWDAALASRGGGK